MAVQSEVLALLENPSHYMDIFRILAVRGNVPEDIHQAMIQNQIAGITRINRK